MKVANSLEMVYSPAWPRPTRKLGGGVNGIIYETNNAHKLMKLSMGNQSGEFRALRNLQNTGIVPKFKNGNGKVFRILTSNRKKFHRLFPDETMKNKATVFFMQKVPGLTLNSWWKHSTKTPAMRKIIQDDVRRLVNKIRQKGYMHGDLHNDNIMVVTNKNGVYIKLKAIDFSRSFRIPKNFSPMPYNSYGTQSMFTKKISEVPTYWHNKSGTYRLNRNMIKQVFGVS